MDFIVIITLLGIAQGLIFGIIFLFLKRRNRRAQIILGFLFICFAISIGHFLLQHSRLYHEFPHLLRVSFPVLFLFGPLFFFYALLLTNSEYRFKWLDLLHLLPFIVILTGSIPFYLLPGEEKLKFLEQIEQGNDKFWTFAVGIGQIIQLFAYIVVTHLRLKRYRKNLTQIRAQTEQIDLSWLYSATIAFFMIFGFMMVTMVLWLFFDVMEKVYSVVVPVMVTIVIYFQGYKALLQKDIVFDREEINRLEGKKYEKSSLTKEKSDDIKNNLFNLFEKERSYLDPGISLSSLSSKLSVSPNHLSQVINENIGITFFDLINQRRIEEAKKLLISKPEYTILAVAMDSGFNSKSAFNSAFKKFTGTTPTAYRNSQAILQ